MSPLGNSIQLFLQVLNFLCVFLLLVSTYVFEVGLISVILREFRGMAIAAGVYLCVFGAYAGVKLVRWQACSAVTPRSCNSPALSRLLTSTPVPSVPNSAQPCFPVYPVTAAFLCFGCVRLRVVTLLSGVSQSLTFDSDASRLELWGYSRFFALSILHKLVAPVYYLMLLDTLRKLGQPRWYSKDYWVQMFQA